MMKAVCSAKKFAQATVMLITMMWITAVSLIAQQQPAFRFTESANSAGLMPALKEIFGHGAAWGDIDQDGWQDLYVGTFDKGGKPNRLFLNKQGKFVNANQKVVEISSRTTGIVFADFDNDGDLDLYIGSMPQPQDKVAGNSLFENTGKGIFKNISANNAACPASFGGRSVTVMDYDGDGLLDILAGEDAVTGYNGSKTKSSRLFKNTGSLQFKDVSAEAGLPPGIPGYGVASADLNNDSWPDFFLASANGGNRLFLNNRKGQFTEAKGTMDLFRWQGAGGDNMVCGISFGDLNLDGLTDIVLGSHFEEPWINPQPLRLFLNKGIIDGTPAFEEITNKAGLVPVPMKTPHVEIQDFDNDGLPDIYTSVIKFSNGKTHPIIFRQVPGKNGSPAFVSQALAVNDFPDATDLGLKGNKAAFFARMLKEKKIIYTAAGPTADFNNDGRLDMFMPSWWPESPSLLLKNETPGGNWLNITVKGSKKVNIMGIGSHINVYRQSKSGQNKVLIGSQTISAGFGYASGQATIAHFGLGKESVVDIEIILPNGNGKLVKNAIRANQQIAIN
jgi:hypothetical protein